MIDIPEDAINARAKYPVTRIEANSFVFTTRFGLRYNIGFTLDQSFADSGIFQFYIVNIDHNHGPKDPWIKDTIKVVIEEFFRSGPIVLLYICDQANNRQGIRDRLFRQWFKEYPHHESYTITCETINFEGVPFFGSILLRKDHPDHEAIIQNFRAFVKGLPDKLDDLQRNC